MGQVVSDVGIIQALNSWLNKVQPAGGDNLTLKLFTNNHTPVNGDTASNYTEATGGGYTAKTLTAGNWTASIVGGISQAVYALQTFTFTGALTTNTTIYGYEIVDADGVHITAELLAVPYVPANNGDFQEVTPLVQGSHGTPVA